MKKDANILWFKDIRIADVGLVGGKNAALGEMFANLSRLGVSVPNGFAVSAHAYRKFLQKSRLKKRIYRILKGLDAKNIKDLQKRGAEVRKLIVSAEFPEDFKAEVTEAYKKLGGFYFPNPDVAVRSSATAEDLPGASFAGQQETYLNVVGIAGVLAAVKKGFASLFTDRAISYRADKGFSHFDIALSVGVQKMARSDLAASGVAFTLDTETGFDKVVVINGIYGLGEYIVQGKVIPDEFVVFKPALAQNYPSIISRKLGDKNIKLVYGLTGTKSTSVNDKARAEYCLKDAEVLKLARWCAAIEKYFSKKYGRIQPMDIEWAKDGKTDKLFIVQARPETVHSEASKNIYQEFRLQGKGKLLLAGTAVGSKIAAGPVKIINDPKNISEFRPGEVLVTEITDPDWEPIMKIAGAIVTDKGGRTSHAAIVSRELGIACVVGASGATRVLKNGQAVTIDCSSGEKGLVYQGKLKYKIETHHLARIPKTRTKIMVNIGSPEEAFKYHYLPVRGVGLGRLEFIINSHIQIHPKALIDFEKLRARKDPAARKAAAVIGKLTRGYGDKKQYYIDKLAEGIAKIGAAFWPHHVIVRFSDFKTNEYRTLVGGEFYEPQEENPMIGWRGASRYYDPKFQEAFKLECRALKKVRDEFGLKNVIPMVPFCRTVEEGIKTQEIMASCGIITNYMKKRGTKEVTPIYVMCEIPSNVVSAEEFLEVFDGMSIGSNDLTQLTLGLDRDSGIVSHVANENNEAVKKFIAQIIKICRAKKKYIGICGQAPSDYPKFAEFLVEAGIESMSLSPDTVVKTILAVAKKEKRFSTPPFRIFSRFKKESQ